MGNAIDFEMSKVLCRILQVNLSMDAVWSVAGRMFTLSNDNVFCEDAWVGNYGDVMSLEHDVLTAVAETVLPAKNVHLEVQWFYLYAALMGETEIQGSCYITLHRRTRLHMSKICIKTPTGSAFEGYYDEDRNQIYYLKRSTEYQWDDLQTAIQRAHRDAELAEFKTKMKAFPAFMPCAGKQEVSLHWKNDGRWVVACRPGHTPETHDWSVSTMVYFLCCMKDVYKSWLDGTTVTHVKVGKDITTAEQIIKTCKDKSPLTCSYIDADNFEAITLRNTSSVRVFAWFKVLKRTVIYGMQPESVDRLVKFLQIPTSSVADMFDEYVKKNGIAEPTAELLRLLKLAGISDVEDKLGTVLDSISK